MRDGVGTLAVTFDLFPQETYPADQQAAPQSLIGDGWVGDETERFFRGRRRWDVTLETLSQEYKSDWTAAHNFLNEEAYLFFLPAFLQVALTGYERDDGAKLLADALAHSLLRMARGEQDHRLLPLLKHYSREQLGVIAQFLLELSRDHYKATGDMDDAEPALELFWRKYLPE
jgi:hypothetical protein